MDANAAQPWIRAIDPRASFRLLCFPHAGGGTADYRTWRTHFPASVDVGSVVLPGRETRMSHRPYHDALALARDLARDLGPLLERAPFALFGYSMGAWIAFELTRELRRRRGPQPEHLFLAARRAPQIPSKLPKISQLPRDEFVAAVQRRYKAIPQQILDEPEILEMFLPTLRADFTLLDSYRFTEEPPLAIPITTFRGTRDDMVDREQIEGWRSHTSAGFEAHEMPGGHFFLRESPGLLTGAVSGALRRYL